MSELINRKNPFSTQMLGNVYGLRLRCPFRSWVTATAFQTKDVTLTDTGFVTLTVTELSLGFKK